jgi:hypothetical protein
MSLPKLEDLIQQVMEYNGFLLNYVRVSDANRLLEECQRLQKEADRFRVALMSYAEHNSWGYSEPVSPNKTEDLFIPSYATGEPGWQVAEEALK